MRRIFFVVTFVFNLLTVKSQTIHQQAYYFRFLAKVKLNEKWALQAETDYRRFTNPDRMWQNFNQLRLHYRLNPHWESVAALTYAVVWQGSLPVPEWRPYQSIQYQHLLGQGWSSAYRFQFEERFIHHSSKTELTEGFGFRLRPRVRWLVSKVINPKWTARFSEELMYHTDDGFNQSQTWLFVERQLNHGFILDLGYLKTYVKRVPSGYIDRDNVRLSIVKNFTLKSI